MRSSKGSVGQSFQCSRDEKNVGVLFDILKKLRSLQKNKQGCFACFGGISAAELCALLNFNEKELDGAISEWGWKSDAGVVIPVKMEQKSVLNPYVEIDMLRNYLQSCESNILVKHAQDVIL